MTTQSLACRPLSVSVSVWGRFHAFQMAAQLARYGSLNQLITTHPRFMPVRYGVPRDQVVSMPYYEAIVRAMRKGESLPQISKHVESRSSDLQAATKMHFARRSATKIDDRSDIYLGWSGSSIEGIRRANSKGLATFVERGSAHISVQDRLLAEEEEIWGVKINRPHPRILERELQEYAEADFISIPSKFVRQSFLEMGVPNNKLIVNNYGVDLTAFHPVPKVDEVFRVVFVGNLTFRKGVPYLVSAWRQMDLEDSELWLIGADPGELHSLIPRFGLAEYTKGRLRGEDLRWHFSQGSVFVLPSIEEGLAQVQAEAMACGLPVICTENTGGEDLVVNGHNGFVIPIRDIEALKDRIMRLHDDRSLLAEMSANALATAEADLSWDRYGDRLIENLRHAKQSASDRESP